MDRACNRNERRRNASKILTDKPIGNRSQERPRRTRALNEEFIYYSANVEMNKSRRLR